MTALSCPACGLQQTLAAPRCARCGAPLDGSQPERVYQRPAGHRSATSHPPAVPPDGVPDDRTVLRDALLTPPGSAALPPWAMPGTVPSQPQQSFWRRLWRRIIGAPEQPADPPDGAPRQ